MARGRKTGGRKPGVLNKRTLLLNSVLQDLKGKAAWNWQKALVEAVKTNRLVELPYWELLLPYLVAKPVMAPMELGSAASPEESVSNAKSAMELLKEIELAERTEPRSGQTKLDSGKTETPIVPDAEADLPSDQGRQS